MSSVAPNNPPFPAYRSNEKGTFAWDSAVRRWPIIIDNALEDLKKAIHKELDEKAKQEGEAIVAAIEGLKNELAADKPLRLLHDNEPDTEDWNRHLTIYFPNTTWFSGTWLFSECYLYRRLRECFSTTVHWRTFDPFFSQKTETFRGSHASVFELARNMPAMIQAMAEEQQEIVYNELLQICLWGNATDLSLLTNMTEEDMKHLQTIEKSRLAQRKKYIIVDDSDKLWERVKILRNSRVDFVLDNAGFEVFVDFVFADWLLQTGKASQVVFNCKTIPWFVSDVIPTDVPALFEACTDRSFFPGSETRPESDFVALETMVKRWKAYVQEGRIEIRSHKFWCYGLPYWYLRSEAPELFENMRQSSLVLFKGDLNFRKLVFDCDWPVTTSFKEAIGPDMSQHFTSIAALRTNKADTIVGLKEDVKEEIEKEATSYEWRCSGKYAVIQYNNIL